MVSVGSILEDVRAGGRLMDRILVVEDDRSVREELKLLLRANGYEVGWAGRPANWRCWT